MMNNLLLSEGDSVSIDNIQLPKGTQITIRPADSKFIKLSNPKAM